MENLSYSSSNWYFDISMILYYIIWYYILYYIFYFTFPKVNPPFTRHVSNLFFQISPCFPSFSSSFQIFPHVSPMFPRVSPWFSSFFHVFSHENPSISPGRASRAAPGNGLDRLGAAGRASGGSSAGRSLEFSMVKWVNTNGWLVVWNY